MNAGVVVIGRNEGARLARCLASLKSFTTTIVYVDSGSTDGSTRLARSAGADVVELDARAPFTAARARNAGVRRLRALAPGTAFAQLLDGDCELSAGWLERAARYLSKHPEVAAVCGLLREKHPDLSVYNMLCDIEWDAPVGEPKACGGIAMVRIEAFDGVGGFREGLIAGEEPEMCVRLRAAGWRIRRLGDEMALHDAAMTRFGQWWRRTKRAGYAYAAGAALHGAPPERHYVPESRRALVWGALLPAVIVALALADARCLALLAVYPLQVVRIALRGNLSGRRAWWRAAFLILGRFPEALGQLSFFLERALGRRSERFEYK